MDKDKIVVMGGSFNPPTVAHRELMKCAIDSVGAYQGVFVPAPYKYVQQKMEKQGQKNMVLPGSFRIKMLETFCREDDRFFVLNYEFEKNHARTIDTIREVQRLFPDDEIYYMVRADQLQLIPRWSRRDETDEFLNSFKILAAARVGENPRETIAADTYLSIYSDSFQIFRVPESLSDINSIAARQYLKEQSPKAECLFNSESWRILTDENAQMYFGICRFKADYDFLSNYYEAPVNYGGIIYRNNEEAFQAQKVLSEEIRREFADLSANRAKSLGRGVLLRSDWEEVKLEIMYEIVKNIFIQHPELRQQLLNTGEQLLTEGNTWRDTFWGVNYKTAQGDNHLGKILMRVREELK